MSLFRFLSTVACRRKGTAGLSHYLETGWYLARLASDEHKRMPQSATLTERLHEPSLR